MKDNHSQLSEEELLNLAQGGSERALGELYRRYLDEIYRYLYYRVARNQPEAEDLTQEVFLRAWETVTAGKKPGKKSNFRALLYRIAHNLAVDRWRTAKEELPLGEEAHGVQARDAVMPEKTIVAQEQNQAVAEAVKELDPKLQDVFICRFINGLSHAETAQVLGLKEGYVRVLQHRALKQIKISVQAP